MSLKISDQALLKTSAYIAGQWCDSDNGETFAVTNPANGAVIAECASCGTAETRRAIEAADKALRSWRETTATWTHSTDDTGEHKPGQAALRLDDPCKHVD